MQLAADFPVKLLHPKPEARMTMAQPCSCMPLVQGTASHKKVFSTSLLRRNVDGKCASASTWQQHQGCLLRHLAKAHAYLTPHALVPNQTIVAMSELF